MGKLLQNFETFDLWKVDREDLTDFTKFVIRIFYEHHMQIPPPIDEVEACVKEDARVFNENAHFYALKTKNGRIFGTINAYLWDRKSELEMEREYNISINEEVEKRELNPPQIWYSGRLAIDRKLINENEELKAKQVLFFRMLITCAFLHVCTHPENLLVAEFDSKLQKTFIKLGVDSIPLSEEKFVLGSDALPILNTGAGLQLFVDRHKHLLNYHV